MRNLLFVLAGLGLLTAAWLFFGGAQRTVDIEVWEGDALRGAYVARLAGCVTCHTLPEGGAMLAGGAPLATPFGTFYGPNITSDPVHGIGSWTGSEFADALVNGHSARTGHLYPVFPYTSYSKMTSPDVADLWAWLQTVEANNTPSRPHDISNPFLARALMAPWKTLFHDVQELAAMPEQSPAWNRGRYIVDGIGHCTECHTPRGSLGVLDRRRHLEGGTLPPKGGSKGEKIPAITAEDLAKRGYARADLLMAFRYGLAPDGDVLGGSMGEVLSDQLEHLSADDLEAIATYLLSGPAN